VHEKYGLVGKALVTYLEEHSSKLFGGHFPTRHTVRRVLIDAGRILCVSKDIPTKQLRKRVQIASRAEHTEEENVLWEWFKDLRNHGIPVSGELLISKMAQIFTQ
jgi:hypothetical protein